MPDPAIHKCADKLEGKKGVTSPYGLCTSMKKKGYNMPETDEEDMMQEIIETKLERDCGCPKKIS